MNYFRRAPAVEASRLPPGDIGRSVIGNTFAFHNDAQSLILNDVERYPGLPIYRAQVIGRDVGLVVDYKLASEVLDGECSSLSESQAAGPSFSHRAAYTDLVGAFFSEPNILLEDTSERLQKTHRAIWDDHMSSYLSDSNWRQNEEVVKGISRQYRSKWQSQDQFDVYKECKALSHEIIFALFLGLDRERDKEEWREALRMTDTSLRGQFSIPLRASLGGYFQSSYSRGLEAQQGFRRMIGDRIDAGACPFARDSQSRGILDESIISHLAMFSCSLVIKAMASYLTFGFIQLTHPACRNQSLESVIKETERLCPPIIGVLRKVMESPWTVPSPQSPADKTMEVPAGWDVWMYLPLINRDTAIYGDDAWEFKPGRWSDPKLPPSLSFGGGDKTCLGMDMVRKVVRTVLETLTDEEGPRTPPLKLVTDLDGSVKDFLGWERARGGWQGIKQLPVQRPRHSVYLRYGRTS